VLEYRTDAAPQWLPDGLGALTPDARAEKVRLAAVIATKH
jgi:hypothetical protein